MSCWLAIATYAKVKLVVVQQEADRIHFRGHNLDLVEADGSAVVYCGLFEDAHFERPTTVTDDRSCSCRREQKGGERIRTGGSLQLHEGQSGRKL